MKSKLILVALLLAFLVVVSASAVSAADDAALVEAPDEIVIEEYVLPAEDIAVETDNVILAEATDDNIVTNETFHNYFDKSGVIRNNITSDELIFDGEFSGLGTGYITIKNKSITLNGNDAILDGISFAIYSDDVTIDGFTMTQTAAVGIYAEGDNIVISNNNIDFTALEKEDSSAISSFASSNLQIDNNVINVKANYNTKDNHAILAEEIDDLIISNNEINYVAVSNETEYGIGRAYAIYVIDSVVTVENNTMDIIVPSILDDWIPVEEGKWLRRSYSEGLKFYSCHSSSVIGNDILLSYDGGSSFGSIYVIDALYCPGFTVADNTIDAAGKSYIYGVIVESNYFVIANNTILASSEYYATGIDIEESTRGIIDSNHIETVAPGAVYPIYGIVGTPSVKITNNEIYGESYYAVGIKFTGSDVTATDNTIQLTGNHTIGIGVNVADLIAENNTIISEASNTGNVEIRDSLGTNTTGIKSKKGTATIIDNEIKTTGKYSVEIDDLDGTVHDNYLVSEKLIGDKSVYSTGPATVYDNLPDMKVILFASDLIKAYDDGQLFVVTAVDENGDPMVGIDLWAYVDDETWVGNTDEDGVVAFNIELPEGIYTVITEFAGDETYAPKTIENTLTVVPKETEIIAPLFEEFTTIEVAEGEAYVELTLIDIDGNPLAGQTVVIELDNESAEFETDENGTVIYDIFCDEGEYTLTVEFAGNEFYAESNATVGIYIFRIDSEIIAPVFGEYTTVEVLVGNATIELTLTSVDGTPLANQTVVIELDNVSDEYITDENGTIEYTIEALAGNYTIVMTFAGDEFYTESNATTEISIVPVESVIIAPVFDEFTTVEVYEGDAGIILELFDIDGNPLAGQTVVIELDNVSAEFETDENGTIEYTIEALAGEYTIVMTFAGDEIYYGSNATTEISIVPVESEIVAPKFVEYDADVVLNGSAIFDIVLLSNDTELANQTVFITFNGLTEEYETDELGYIEYLIVAPAGNYTIEMVFEGDEIYLESNATAEITITPVEAEILAPELVEFSIAEVIAGNATYTLLLVDADGNPLADRQINITFNGVTEEFITDEDGVVEYVINATAGNYTIDMAFESDGFYESANASGIVVIKPEQKQAKIYLRNALYFVLQTKYVTVTLWDANNNPIANKTVYIRLNDNSWKYSGVTDENGNALIKVGVGFGNHQATISFEGDDEYAAASKVGKVRVIKETPSLMLPGAYTKFKASEPTKTIKVYLKDRYDKPLLPETKVFVTINGIQYVGLINTEGIASINIILNKAGVYDVDLYYTGNTAYNAVRKSTKITIV